MCWQTFKLLIVLIVDETGDAHVRLRDTSLVPSFQDFSHVIELALLVTGTRRDPVVQHTQQSINVLPQFVDLLYLPLVEGTPEPRPYAGKALTGMNPTPQPTRNGQESGGYERKQQAIYHVGRFRF
jgi:hypothetical protein